MRADLSPAVARACESTVRPTLVFDRARIEANFVAWAAAARSASVTLLFAAKSFPHEVVWRLALKHCHGFDAGGLEELLALPRTAVLSIADPTGRAVQAAPQPERGERLIVSCDSAVQIAAAPAHAEIALRVSASITGSDPAVGAVLDGTGHRRSRFGFERNRGGPQFGPDGDGQREAIEGEDALLRAIAGRPIGVHVHHGPITATSAERFIHTANEAIGLATMAGMRPRFINLGGAWHGIADIGDALAKIRAAVPREIEIIVEPGRALAHEAGFAVGTIMRTRELSDRVVCVSDLSRLCHLRWSPVELVGTAPHPGTGRNVLVVGATCSEDDVVGEWTAAPDALAAGARLTLRHVSGYAVGWNTSFGGVPPADVMFVE